MQLSHVVCPLKLSSGGNDVLVIFLRKEKKYGSTTSLLQPALALFSMWNVSPRRALASCSRPLGQNAYKDRTLLPLDEIIEIALIRRLQFC